MRNAEVAAAAAAAAAAGGVDDDETVAPVSPVRRLQLMTITHVCSQPAVNRVRLRAASFRMHVTTADALLNNSVSKIIGLPVSTHSGVCIRALNFAMLKWLKYIAAPFTPGCFNYKCVAKRIACSNTNETHLLSDRRLA